MLWHASKALKKGGGWRCRIRKREANRAYRKSGKAKERDRAYRETEKGKESIRNYEESQARKEQRREWERTRVQIRIAGVSNSIRVPPEHKDAFKKKIADFRSQQRQQTEEA